MTQYIFDPEATGKAFAKEFPGFAKEMDVNGVTPEDLAGYLNFKFDQKDRQMLAAMMTDHEIQFDFGCIYIRERNGFKEWKEETGWSITD